MSLVFAALAPHPPVLIPTIGKSDAKHVQKTAAALAALEEALYVAKPQTIIVISPHGHLFADSFTVNYHTRYVTDLRAFGDLTITNEYAGDGELASRIREASKQSHFSVSMISEPTLDHGTSVPLYFLASHLPHVSIVPLGFSGADLKTHFEFGTLLQEEIQHTNKRVAVIASGDLSHALKTDAPEGFNKAGAEFDAKMQELLASHNSAGIVSLPPDFTDDAAECGLRSIVMLLGILKDIHYSTKIYSYEAPFGVGYLTAEFSLP